MEYKEWDQLSEKEQLLQYISDEYKRAYGMRPRGDFYNNRTVEQLRVDLDELNAYANEQYDLEKAREVERLQENLCEKLSKPEFRFQARALGL